MTQSMEKDPINTPAMKQTLKQKPTDPIIHDKYRSTQYLHREGEVLQFYLVKYTFLTIKEKSTLKKILKTKQTKNPTQPLEDD